MKKLVLIVVLSLSCSFLYGCAEFAQGFKAGLNDEPATQRVHQITANQYSIELIGSGTAATFYTIFEQKAAEACNNNYEVVERQFTPTEASISGPTGKIVGVVKCL